MTRSAPPRRGTTTAALSGRAGDDPTLSAFAVSDGTMLAVRDTGPASARATAVLVHGWTQDHTSWDGVTDELTRDPSIRVIAYDGRGHGWSDAGPRSTATIEQIADDLADVITGLVPQGHVVLAGHSLGGPVTMAFAERHRQLLHDRVVGVAQALRLGLYGPGAATKHNRLRTAAQVSRSHPATTAALVDAMARHDRLPMLADLEGTPTVVLVGTKDALCPMAHARAIAGSVPNAELVVYPEAGHMLPYERPAEVADQIVRLANTSAD